MSRTTTAVAVAAGVLLATGLTRKPSTEHVDLADLPANLRAFADDIEAGDPEARETVRSLGFKSLNALNGYIGLRDLFRDLHARDEAREAFERGEI